LGQKKVLIIQSDESPADLLQNLEARGFDPNCENLRIKTRWDVTYIPQLYEEIKEWQPDFILLDSLTSISAKSCISENDKEYARPVLELVDVAKPTNSHIMLIHHSSRLHGESRGSPAIPAAVSQVLTIKRVSDAVDDTRRHISFTKSRSRRPAKYEINFNPETRQWELTGEVNREDTDAPLKQRIIDFLRENPGVRYTALELADCHLLVNRNTIRKALSALSEDQIISRHKPIHKKAAHVYWLGRKPEENLVDPSGEWINDGSTNGSTRESSQDIESSVSLIVDPQNASSGQKKLAPQLAKSGSTINETSKPSQGEESLVCHFVDPLVDPLVDPRDQPQHSVTWREGDLARWTKRGLFEDSVIVSIMAVDRDRVLVLGKWSDFDEQRWVEAQDLSGLDEFR